MEIECPDFKGNGWLPRSWSFNSRVQLTEEDCPFCYATGSRLATPEEAELAADLEGDAQPEQGK